MPNTGWLCLHEKNIETVGRASPHPCSLSGWLGEASPTEYASGDAQRRKHTDEVSELSTEEGSRDEAFVTNHNQLFYVLCFILAVQCGTRSVWHAAHGTCGVRAGCQAMGV